MAAANASLGDFRTWNAPRISALITAGVVTNGNSTVRGSALLLSSSRSSYIFPTAVVSTLSLRLHMSLVRESGQT